jgi:hypothetical protein
MPEARRPNPRAGMTHRAGRRVRPAAAAAACSNHTGIRTAQQISVKVGESQSSMIINSVISHRRRQSQRQRRPHGQRQAVPRAPRQQRVACPPARARVSSRCRWRISSRPDSIRARRHACSCVCVCVGVGVLAGLTRGGASMARQTAALLRRCGWQMAATAPHCGTAGWRTQGQAAPAPARPVQAPELLPCSINIGVRNAQQIRVKVG